MANFIKANTDRLAHSALYITKEAGLGYSHDSVQQTLFKLFLNSRESLAREIAQRHPEFSAVPKLMDTHSTMMLFSPEKVGWEFARLLSNELDLMIPFYTSANWYAEPEYVSLLLVYSCWAWKDQRDQFGGFIQELFDSLDQHDSLSGGAKVFLSVAMWIWNYNDFQNRVMTLASQTRTDSNNPLSKNYTANKSQEIPDKEARMKAAVAEYWAKRKKSGRADDSNNSKVSQGANYIMKNMDALVQVVTHLATSYHLQDLSSKTIEGNLMAEWMSRRAGVASVIAQKHPEFRSFINQINRHDQALAANDPEDDLLSVLNSEAFEVLDYYKTAGWEQDPDFLSFHLVYNCWVLKWEKETHDKMIKQYFSFLDMHKELSAAAMLNLAVSLWLWNYNDFQTLAARNIVKVHYGLIPRP